MTNTEMIAAAIRVYLKIVSAREYDDEFYPDYDGWSGYSNDAYGEVTEMILALPSHTAVTILDAVVMLDGEGKHEAELRQLVTDTTSQ